MLRSWRIRYWHRQKKERRAVLPGYKKRRPLKIPQSVMSTSMNNVSREGAMQAHTPRGAMVSNSKSQFPSKVSNEILSNREMHDFPISIYMYMDNQTNLYGKPLSNFMVSERLGWSNQPDFTELNSSCNVRKTDQEQQMIAIETGRNTEDGQKQETRPPDPNPNSKWRIFSHFIIRCLEQLVTSIVHEFVRTLLS